MLSSWKICCAQLPQRWIFAVMASLAMTNAYNMRICLSLSITEMVKAKAVTSSNGTISDETCPSSDSTSSSSSSAAGGTYDWDQYTQLQRYNRHGDVQFWNNLEVEVDRRQEKFERKIDANNGDIAPQLSR